MNAVINILKRCEVFSLPVTALPISSAEIDEAPESAGALIMMYKKLPITHEVRRTIKMANTNSLFLSVQSTYSKITFNLYKIVFPSKPLMLYQV